MSAVTDHVLFRSIEPLLQAIGGEVIEAEQATPGDVVLEWQGAVIGAVRIGSLNTALDRMITTIEEELGGPLANLERTAKQRAVRILDERGAFLLRKSIDEVADRMKVSRITIYNYLGIVREQTEATSGHQA